MGRGPDELYTWASLGSSRLQFSQFGLQFFQGSRSQPPLLLGLDRLTDLPLQGGPGLDLGLLLGLLLLGGDDDLQDLQHRLQLAPAGVGGDLHEAFLLHGLEFPVDGDSHAVEAEPIASAQGHVPELLKVQVAPVGGEAKLLARGEKEKIDFRHDGCVDVVNDVADQNLIVNGRPSAITFTAAG